MRSKHGTWVETSMYGKAYMGMERSTFVVDADGRVAEVMRKVKPAEHADDVLAALSKLPGARRDGYGAATDPAVHTRRTAPVTPSASQ